MVSSLYIKVFDHGQCCTLADGIEVEQIFVKFGGVHFVLNLLY